MISDRPAALMATDHLRHVVSSAVRHSRLRSPAWLCCLASLGLVLASAMTASACSVPVFAYALRRWEPDLHVFKTAHDQAWRSSLNLRLGGLDANLDVQELSTELESGVFWDQYSVWMPGDLDEQRLAELVDSPARRRLTRELAMGTSVVWLFLHSGDQAADAAVLARLHARLEHLRTVITLPNSELEIDQSTRRTLEFAGPSIRLAFTVLEIDPDDAAEWSLVAQLRSLGSPDGQALLAPVFGRARALDCKVADEWSDSKIDEAVLYLTAACSCQVKAENPGIDLLVSCNWPRVLRENMEIMEAAPRNSLSVPAEPETVIITPSRAALQVGPSSRPPTFWGAHAYALIACGTAMLVGLLLLVFLRSRARSTGH